MKEKKVDTKEMAQLGKCLPHKNEDISLKAQNPCKKKYRCCD